MDGVLARIMRDVCADESPDLKWVMFDGPVDTLWIESMNTLLDDNKILTLLNGERINMPSQVCQNIDIKYLAWHEIEYKIEMTCMHLHVWKEYKKNATLIKIELT